MSTTGQKRVCRHPRRTERRRRAYQRTLESAQSELKHSKLDWRITAAKETVERYTKLLASLGLLLVLFTGCSTISFTVDTSERCGAIQNDARADCGDVADTVRLASEFYGPRAAEVLASSRVTVTAARYLYRNAAGNEVKGTTECLWGKPHITLDRSMRGLLHELYHAGDCLDGREMVHDARHAVADRMLWRFTPPRREWTAEEVAETRAAEHVEVWFGRMK